MAIDPTLQAKLNDPRATAKVSLEAPVRTQLPAEADALIKSGQYRDLPPQLTPAYMRGVIDDNELLAAIKGTPVFNPTSGPVFDYGSGPTTAAPSFMPGEQQPQGTGYGQKTAEQIQAEANAINQSGSANPAPVRASAGISATLPDAPTAPTDPRQSYQALSQQQGLDALQSQLDANAANTRALQDQIASDKYKAKGQPVSSVYLGRKLTHIDAETADALNRLKTERANLSDQLRTRSQTVRTIMQTQSEDYRTALTSYDRQYNAALSLFKAQAAAEDKEDTQERTAAAANAKVILGVIKDHPDIYNNPSSDDLANWSQLEVQAGLPEGFIQAAAKASPQVKISHWSTDASGTTYAYGIDKTGKPVILESFKNTGKPIVRAAGGKGGSSGGGTNSDEKEIAAFNKDVAAWIPKLDSTDTKWRTAWDALHVKYPKASVETIDNALGLQRRNN